jgi:hypothetical protein
VSAQLCNTWTIKVNLTVFTMHILDDFSKQLLPPSSESADAVYCHVLMFTTIVRLQKVKKSMRIAFQITSDSIIHSY